MKKFTIGNIFKHPGHKLTRFVLCAIDLNDETFMAYNTVTGEVVEFDFSDFEDVRTVKPGANDSILS